MQAPTLPPAGETATRQRVGVARESASLDVIVEGRGPAVVLLPSSLRDSEDFDELAAGIADVTWEAPAINALIKEIPAHDRLLLIEDTAEVVIPAANSVALLAVKGALGEARVTANDLLQAALRMRPDRIILGEVRGSEALTFLRAINTGHPGSLTTIHADSPAGAIEQLALIALQAGTRLTRSDIVDYVSNTIDAIVQLERHEGRRRIAQVMLTRT